MKVALTVNDFLNRAELVYPDRVAVVDDPDQPAESWGEMTYGELAKRAKAIAAGLDAMGFPSLLHIRRCRRSTLCRSRWTPLP